MPDTPRLTFLVDVDNTLLDNDGAKREMDRRLLVLLGAAGAERFWAIYEEVRAELGVVDIPRTMARFAAEGDGGGEPTVDRRPSTVDLRFRLAELFMRFPFDEFLYPATLETIRHLRALGTVAILSDGDAIFQVAKIYRSGLVQAVDGYALVYFHKEEHLDEIAGAFPADHYVLVDDKPTVIERVAARMGSPLSTVFVRQGKYAAAVAPGPWPGAGLTVDGIGELLNLGRESLIAAGRGSGAGAVPA